MKGCDRPNCDATYLLLNWSLALALLNRRQDDCTLPLLHFRLLLIVRELHRPIHSSRLLLLRGMSAIIIYIVLSILLPHLPYVAVTARLRVD